MDFKCSGCGACCMIMGCRFLTPDMKCSIYPIRPDECNVDTMWHKRGKPDRLSYLIQNTLVCHRLIDYYGMSEDYKIDILDYVENTNGSKEKL